MRRCRAYRAHGRPEIVSIQEVGRGPLPGSTRKWGKEGYTYMAVVLESDNLAGTRPAGSRVARALALLARYALPLTLLLALVVRVVLIARAPGVLDGDEALVGIQAESIAAGAAHPLPVFFYGQHYMGALEAYLIAGVFRLVGPSVPALRVVPLLFALLFVLLTYELTRRVVGRQAAIFAALLAAL